MYFNDLTLEKIKKIFKNYPLYSQDGKKQLVSLELYIPNTNIFWLLTEGSIENNDFIFYGYCRITDAEFGYVSLNELKKLSFNIHLNIYTPPVPLDKLKLKYFD